jgi:hypothetical protein
LTLTTKLIAYGGVGAALAATSIPIPLQPYAFVIMRSILLPVCAFVLIIALRHIGSSVVRAVAAIVVALRLTMVATGIPWAVREMVIASGKISTAYASLGHHNPDLLVFITTRRAVRALFACVVEDLLLLAMCIVIIVYGRASQSAVHQSQSGDGVRR